MTDWFFRSIQCLLLKYVPYLFICKDFIYIELFWNKLYVLMIQTLFVCIDNVHFGVNKWERLHEYYAWESIPHWGRLLYAKISFTVSSPLDMEMTIRVCYCEMIEVFTSQLYMDK